MTLTICSKKSWSSCGTAMRSSAENLMSRLGFTGSLWTAASISRRKGALTSVYILFYKKYDFNMIQSFDVLNASRMMKKFKKSYIHMIFISWSVAIAILVSFCPMIIKAWSTPLKAICAISFLVIVLFVCLFLEYHYSKKIIDSCDSIIKRLDNCNE